MARITWASGQTPKYRSIGGTCFQSNKHGSTVKKKPSIVFPARVNQRYHVDFFSQVLRLWNSLSAANKIVWNTFASTFPQYSTHAPFNQLSGFLIYTRINLLRYNAGLSFLSAPALSVFTQVTIDPYILKVATDLFLLFRADIYYFDCFLSLFFSNKTFPTYSPAYLSFRYVGTDITDNIHIFLNDFFISSFGKLPSTGDIFCAQFNGFGRTNGQLFPIQTFFISIP